MGIGIISILIFCAAVMISCRIWGVNWGRTALAAAIGGATLYFSYGIAFNFRLQHDMQLSSQDGQSGMDVLAFAILAAPIAAIVAVILFLLITKPRHSSDDS